MKKYVLFFIILNIVTGVYCGKSLTFVVDTTVSMSDELNVLKTYIGQVLNSINRSDIDNFVLVTFKDARLESPFITENSRDLASRVNILTPSGGGSDCEENSLEGIEAALSISKPNSPIFVFTDAYAKDYNRLQNVETLCKERHSQVIIFLSGYCSLESPGMDVYFEIVKACSGSYFNFSTTYDLRQAFHFMKTAVNTEWTDIAPQEIIMNSERLSFSVDSFTTDFLISVSGQFVSTSLTDSMGQHVRTYEKLLYTRHAQALHLLQPYPGQYTLSVRGQGSISVTFYERNFIPFQYGFSTRLPRSLTETSSRPMAGWRNYVMISIDKSIRLESMEWLNAGDSAKSIQYLEQKAEGLFVSGQHLVEPRKSFRIWIIGTDIETNQKIKASTSFIFPQVEVANPRRVRPVAEILDSPNCLVDFGTEFVLACKISAVPRPNIRWKDANGATLQGEDILLEYPGTYISYLTISNATENSTWYCQSENILGEASDTIDIYVNRTFTFDVVATPEDTQVEYGGDLTLNCQVDAYPEAKITWKMNGTELSFASKAAVEGNTISVRNAGLEDGGSYECVASNEVETQTFSADVRITGLETPSVKLEETEINAKPGDRISVEVRVVAGKPYPQVTWQFRSSESYDFNDLPFSARTDEGKLVIPSVVKSNGGTYRCTASNVAGDDYKDFVVNILSPPTINSNVTAMTVREAEPVLMRCDVDAVPRATVRWEMTQDDVSLPLSARQTTDDQYTLHFTAFWNDSGNYHCIAENSAGRAEITITLNVLVPPYIEPPKSNEIRVKAGLPLDLPCVVLYGSPAPSLRWDFTAVASVPRTIARRNSTLHFDSVSQINEGTYQCVAENIINTDRIKYTLKVHN